MKIDFGLDKSCRIFVFWRFGFDNFCLSGFGFDNICLNFELLRNFRLRFRTADCFIEKFGSVGFLNSVEIVHFAC